MKNSQIGYVISTEVKRDTIDLLPPIRLFTASFVCGGPPTLHHLTIVQGNVEVGLKKEIGNELVIVSLTGHLRVENKKQSLSTVNVFKLARKRASDVLPRRTLLK